MVLVEVSLPRCGFKLYNKKMSILWARYNKVEVTLLFNMGIKPGALVQPMATAMAKVTKISVLQGSSSSSGGSSSTATSSSS